MDASPLGNSTGEEKVLFALDTYALQMQDIQPGLFRGQIFSVNLGSVDEALKREGAINDSALKTSEIIVRAMNSSTAAVEIAENFISDIPECGPEQPGYTRRLSYFVFMTNILFQSMNLTTAGIGSVIISTRLSCAGNGSLPTPITTRFQTSEEVCSELNSVVIVAPCN